VRAYGLLGILSVIWGIAFVAIRVADFQLSAINLTLLRWLVASAGYLAIAPFVGRPKTRFETKDLPRLLVISLCNVAGYHISLNYAEKTVSSGLAGLLISFGPVFVVLFSAASLKERINSRIALSLACALLGALILSVPDLGSATSVLGPLEVVLAGLSYAVFAVLAKPLVGKYGALPVAIWAGAIGTAMLLPLLPTSGFLPEVEALTSLGWESVLYLSLLSTVLGYSLFYTLVGRGKVSTLSIQLYLAPVVSVVGGALLLGEAVTAYTVAGGALLLAAVGLATTRRNEKKKANTS
jgi:drug/metabolite transporter (DMT)-like permease